MDEYTDIIDELTNAVENHRIMDVEDIYKSIKNDERISKNQMDAVDEYIGHAYDYWKKMN